MAAVLAVSFALGKVTLAFATFAGAGAAVWPPSGFAFAAMLVLGRPIWPAVFAGAFLDYVTASGQVAASLMTAAGNTIETVIAATLVDRVAGGRNVFKRADTVFRFLAIAAFASTPFSATLGACARIFSGWASWTDFAYLWLTWWLSHLCGLLVVAPCLTMWKATPSPRGRWPQIAESAALVAMLLGVGVIVFGGRFPSDTQYYPLEFLWVPLLLWTAFRFGRRETAGAILLLVAVAIWGTLHGYGPFARDSRPEALVLVQAYATVMAITGLVMAAALGEHREAQEQLRQLATTDSLTGIANYRRLIEILRVEIGRSHRTKRPFAIVFVDMDGLKTINDRHGHLVGSRALARVADALRRSIRDIDTPARFGGDEFAVVLVETGEEGGRAVLRRVSERLAADRDTPALSVTGGVAVFPRDGDSPTQLLRVADQLLYAAKAKARSALETRPTDLEKTGTLF